MVYLYVLCACHEQVRINVLQSLNTCIVIDFVVVFLIQTKFWVQLKVVELTFGGVGPRARNYLVCGVVARHCELKGTPGWQD